MNERIKELAEQVGVNCVVPTVGTLEYPNKGEVDHLKKFAELIVKECVDICNRLYFDNYPDAEDFERSEEGDAIKKHFGVK